jgi:hypothetical protein
MAAERASFPSLAIVSRVMLARQRLCEEIALDAEICGKKRKRTGIRSKKQVVRLNAHKNGVEEW